MNFNKAFRIATKIRLTQVVTIPWWPTLQVGTVGIVVGYVNNLIAVTFPKISEPVYLYTNECESMNGIDRILDDLE